MKFNLKKIIKKTRIYYYIKAVGKPQLFIYLFLTYYNSFFLSVIYFLLYYIFLVILRWESKFIFKNVKRLCD